MMKSNEAAQFLSLLTARALTNGLCVTAPSPDRMPDCAYDLSVSSSQLFDRRTADRSTNLRFKNSYDSVAHRSHQCASCSTSLEAHSS